MFLSIKLLPLWYNFQTVLFIVLVCKLALLRRYCLPDTPTRGLHRGIIFTEVKIIYFIARIKIWLNHQLTFRLLRLTQMTI